MNLEEIKKNHPKSYEAFIGYMRTSLNNLQKAAMGDVPKDADVSVPEITNEMAEAYGAIMIPNNPRVLYEFFDSLGVKIGVFPTEDLFTYLNNVAKESKTAKTRLDAEVLAFTDAFKATEEKLSKNG